MTKTTAELLVKEDEYKGQFEIKTYFSGGVNVKLFKKQQMILELDLSDLDDIFENRAGFKKDNHGWYFLTKGECKAKFGIEQKIELHQKPL